ncbi:MAG: hypothetical protein WEB19_02120 [Acidimicrobiia bacterium]
MVSAAPEQIRRDAEAMFRKSAIPNTLEFSERLSPLNQRLFLVELWDALSRLKLAPPSRDDLRALVELIEAWEATADLDSAPEVAREIRRKKTYRPVENL